MRRRRFLTTYPLLACLILAVALIGCGTTKTRVATEQLLMSDAVDEAVARVDFRAMSGAKVYFDTQYIKNIKGFGFVNADYIISSLRQQMIAADCRLQDDKEEADFIIEARVGTLGTNGHEVVYGVPANQSLTTAATLVPNVPQVPSLPEISLAKKDAQLGAAKIAVFAYERESKRPVWQSGVAQAKSDAQDVWIMGAGPFQRGSIYKGTQFAGHRIRVPKLNDEPEYLEDRPIALQQQYHFPRHFAPPWTVAGASSDVEAAGFVGQPSQEVVDGNGQRLPPVVDENPPAAAAPEPQSAPETAPETAPE